MAQIPVWLRGRDWAACTCYGCLVAADGTLSVQGAVPTIVQARSIRERSTPVKDENSATAATRTHHDLIQEDFHVDLEVQLGRNGVNPLAALTDTYDIIKIVSTQGKERWTFYGSRGDFETGVAGKMPSGNTERMTLDNVDIGETNPVLELVS